jgi:hypothetical protein
MPTQAGKRPTPTKENDTTAQPRRNAEIDAKIDLFIAENPSFIESLKAQPREVLERKLILGRIREIEAQQQYSQKVLSWLNKPENAELKETLVSTLPPYHETRKAGAAFSEPSQNGHQKPGHQNVGISRIKEEVLAAFYSWSLLPRISGALSKVMLGVVL